MTALEKQQKKISVIIPVYNAEKYIRETLDSIIKQSYKNLEIILIDNGSKDRSPDIIQKYEAKYPEIHMIDINHLHYVVHHLKNSDFRDFSQ